MATASFTFFDTLASSERLKAQGFSEPQARAVVTEIRSAQESGIEQLATKNDVGTLRFEMKEQELRLENRLKDVQIRLGSMIVGLGGVLIGVKYFG